jgi:hypothetical protein
VNIEALLIASGQNIKRLVAVRERGPLKQAAALRLPDPVSRCRTHVSGRSPLLLEQGCISAGCGVWHTRQHLGT